jgi:hypothetical protein
MYYHAVQEGVLVFQDLFLSAIGQLCSEPHDRARVYCIGLSAVPCIPCDAGCQAVGSGADAARQQE